MSEKELSLVRKVAFHFLIFLSLLHTIYQYILLDLKLALYYAFVTQEDYEVKVSRTPHHPCEDTLLTVWHVKKLFHLTD